MSRAVETATPSTGGWRHFPHGADVGIEGVGASVADAFEQAAMALTAAMLDPRAVSLRESVEVRCQAPQRDLLLVDWLNAIVYEMATRRMVFGRFQVDLDGGRLVGRAIGEPLDRRRHHVAVEVKGATYTELAVAQESDGRWHARCVVDV